VSHSVRFRDPAGHSRRKVFVRKVDAARWLAENVGLSPSRIRNAAQVLGQILDAAAAGRLHRNPAQGLRRPRIVEREMTILSAAELERLACQIADPYGMLVRFIGWTGSRIGEAAALRVGRLDVLGRRVDVVEAATEVNGRLAWGPTKTGERRTVPLPHFLAERLGAYLVDRPHDPDDLVFTMPQGGPLRASKGGERYFRPAAASAGLPEASASTISGTPRRHWRSGRTPR
jgi:integrase